MLWNKQSLYKANRSRTLVTVFHLGRSPTTSERGDTLLSGKKKKKKSKCYRGRMQGPHKSFARAIELMHSGTECLEVCSHAGLWSKVYQHNENGSGLATLRGWKTLFKVKVLVSACCR